MKRQQLTAITVVLALALGAAQTRLLAQGGQSGQISGTAKDEAKKPYTENSVRLRDIKQGQLTATTPLDAEGAFRLENLAPASYLVELLDKKGKVICSEGPFDLTQQRIKSGVIVDCGHIAGAYWLLAAGAAAGVTAGVVAATGNASPSR